MGNHDESLGYVIHSLSITILSFVPSSILIATWVGTILSTHVAREAVHYFKSYPGDKIALKLLVSVALFTGLILQIASYADVYMVCNCILVYLTSILTIGQYTITHWGNEEYLLRQVSLLRPFEYFFAKIFFSIGQSKFISQQLQ